MGALGRLSIKVKLTLIVMLTSAVALLLASVASIAYEQITLRRTVVRELSTLVDIVGTNTAAALLFDDPVSARSTLATFGADMDVVHAVLYTRDGGVFAEYIRPNSMTAPAPVPRAADYEFSGGYLHIWRSVVFDAEIVGSTYIRFATRRMRSRLIRYVGIVSVIMLLSSVVAFLLSSRLQRVISEPILQLARIARSHPGGPGHDVAVHEQDELGLVLQSVNDWLTQIQERESELQSVLRTVGEGIITIDSENRIVMVNEEATNIWRVSREELTRSRLEDLVAEPDRDKYVADMLHDVVGVRLEVHGVREHGSTFPLEILVTETMVGERVLFTAAVRDITQRREAEDKIREWNAELERHVSARTAQLRRVEAERSQLMHRILTVQEEEQARIARELHDQAGQALSSLLVGLRLIEQASSFEEARRHIRPLRAATETTLEQVRQLSFDIRPSSLDNLGLAAALEHDVGRLLNPLGITVEFHMDDIEESRLAPDLETALYRAINGAFTNIAQHSEARTVSVSVQRIGSRVSAVVGDDGVGFDVDATLSGPAEGKFGLMAIEERLRPVGGRVRFESTPGEGCEMFIAVDDGAGDPPK